MNEFDKQRIENAIWTLIQYEEEVTKIAKTREWDKWDCERVFDVLKEVKEELGK